MTTPEPFPGRIARTYEESQPSWPPRPEDAAGGRPNVVVVLFDDTGFANFGCYGSTIETPNLDALAENGLRFSNFHVTALCSPTRASLLTGRNHHSVGMGKLASANDAGFPGMRARISNQAATLGEMLQEEGYATYAVGKWHLGPADETSGAGPFRDWPLQRGFDRYYGFLFGATDQFYPELTYDNHHVDPPATPEQGYHLTEDLVDRALDFLRDKESHRPDQPFFLYFALGATHDPHQAPRPYIEKYRGRFDAGWDAMREEWHQRQLESGIIPPGTALAPRNPGVEPWDGLSPNQQRFMTRLQEAFAGFLDHSDAQIGRLVQHLEQSGQLDNTILLVLADNGASAAGGPTGLLHADLGGRRATNEGVLPRADALHVDDVDSIESRLDDIGGPRSSSDVPWGWAQAGSTPLRWYKSDVYGGGVRVPLILHWPDRIAGPGICHQFHHVSDVVPTLLEVLGLEAPSTYRGVSQLPVTGTSFAYTFEQPDAAPRNTVQYFEMSGNRGIWMDGWKAVTRHEPGTPFGDDEWELYHVDEDFSETVNLAQERPDKLRALVDQWWIEAGIHGVLPLEDGAARPVATARAATRFHYKPPISHLPSGVGTTPPLFTGEWTISTEIERPDAGAEGVLFSIGATYGGLSFYVLGNRLHLDYNVRTEITGAQSTVDLPLGRATVGARLEAERRDAAGRLTLVVDGADVGTTEIPNLATDLRRWGGADVGLDRLSPVSDRYEAPFPFSGTIHTVDIEVTPFSGSAPPPTADAESAEL